MMLVVVVLLLVLLQQVKMLLLQLLLSLLRRLHLRLAVNKLLRHRVLRQAWHDGRGRRYVVGGLRPGRRRRRQLLRGRLHLHVVNGSRLLHTLEYLGHPDGAQLGRGRALGLFLGTSPAAHSHSPAAVAGIIGVHADAVGLDVVLRQLGYDRRRQFPARVGDAVLRRVSAQKCGALHPELLKGRGDDRREAFGATTARAVAAGTASVHHVCVDQRRRRGGWGGDGSDARVRHAGNVYVRGHAVADHFVGAWGNFERSRVHFTSAKIHR